MCSLRSWLVHAVWRFSRITNNLLRWFRSITLVNIRVEMYIILLSLITCFTLLGSVLVSCLVGAVWLLGLSNPQGEQQLGRFLLFATFAVAESVVCGTLWSLSSITTTNPFQQTVRFLSLCNCKYSLLHLNY